MCVYRAITTLNRLRQLRTLLDSISCEIPLWIEGGRGKRLLPVRK